MRQAGKEKTVTKKNDNFIMLPTVDVCFKGLMYNPKVRKGFIAALLGTDPAAVRETVLLPTALRQEYPDEKLGILDVRALMEDGAQINMEMQAYPFGQWDARSLFYLSKMYTEQIGRGDPYTKLKKCIHVSILDFVHFEEDQECFRTICFCDEKTGKKYRLPTEAEWEYAARGGKETPYFFEGNPKDFSDQGFWRKFFDAETDSISSYVIYAKNSENKTQEPSSVKANPFGLKNMLGNVMEYCADKYSPEAYKQGGEKVSNPICTEGEEWVVRGGNYTSDAADVRCAARSCTQHDAWLKTDPQQPKSIWWYSDIKGIGFRVVCEYDK